jgi:hypothetical protein
MIALKLFICVASVLAALGLTCAAAIALWRDPGVGRRVTRHTPADPHLVPFGDVPHTGFIARDLATRAPQAIELSAYANDAGTTHAWPSARRRRRDDYQKDVIRGIERALVQNERLEFERRLLNREIRIRKLRGARR